MLKPPSDYLQSVHGGDDVRPMWLPPPAHLQNILFLPQEYSDLDQINDQCWFHI